MLDLFFTNDDYMIVNLKSADPLGKSDHVGLEWTFITYSAIEYMVRKDVTTGKRISQQ